MTGASTPDPGVFHDLPGQDVVVAQLRRAAAGAAALLAGRPPEPGAMTHAWLFTGPPGSGAEIPVTGGAGRGAGGDQRAGLPGAGSGQGGRGAGAPRAGTAWGSGPLP